MKHLFTRTGTLAVCLLLSSTVGFAQSSSQDLMVGVLKALEKSDRQALKNYLISDSDVKQFVWPNMPATLTSGTNSAKFTSMHFQTSDAGLEEDLRKFGNHKWELVKVDLGEPKKGTNGYKLFPPPLVTVKDEQGTEQRVRLVGGILERGGTFKITTYYVSPTLK